MGRARDRGAAGHHHRRPALGGCRGTLYRIPPRGGEIVTNVDPTTLAVVRGRLKQTTDEMDTVFERMAFSPVISDAWDRADGIYRPDNGGMIVQGERGLPIFVGTMQYATRAVIDHAERSRSGDIFLINDPYLGGTHIMDVKMVRPSFTTVSCFATWRTPGTGLTSVVAYLAASPLPPPKSTRRDCVSRRSVYFPVTGSMATYSHSSGQQPHPRRHRRRRPCPGNCPAGRRGAAR